MKKTFLAICCVSMAGCVFSASLDDLEDSSGTNNTTTTNNATNNVTNNSTNNAVNNPTNNTTNNTTNNQTSADCAGLETVLKQKVASGLRQGLQVDWHDGAMLVMVDLETEFQAFVIAENGYRSIPTTGLPRPFVDFFTPFTFSYDVSMLEASPARFVFSEARSDALNVIICSEAQGQCQPVPNMPSIMANGDVQSAVVRTTPDQVMMIGYSYDMDPLGPTYRRSYSSRSLTFDRNNNTNSFDTGNVFASVQNRDVVGVDFSYVEGTKFRVAGGATGGTKFFGYEDSSKPDVLETCIDVEGTGLPFYKAKTQHGTDNMLFRTSQGLILSNCVNARSTPFTNQGDVVRDFDLVPIEGGDLVVWIQGPPAATVAEGSIVKNGDRSALTFRNNTSSHYFIRAGRVGEDVIIILAGAEEGVVMIRGTEAELRVCYGGASL